jgi:hypothetical protein
MGIVDRKKYNICQMKSSEAVVPPEQHQDATTVGTLCHSHNYTVIMYLQCQYRYCCKSEMATDSYPTASKHLLALTATLTVLI